jgi:hypothetical protein
MSGYTSEVSPYAIGDESTLQGQTVAGQGVTYSQNKDEPREESNPMGNPEYVERVNREALMKNINDLSRLELVRLSRLSYLSHANRYQIREAVPVKAE